MTKNLTRRLNDSIFQHTALRLFYAFIWTALVTLVLVQSSSQPVVGPPAPPGPPALEREIFLTSAHVVAFSILTFLWWWGLLPISPRALTHAVIIGLVLGIVTEGAQTFVPDRSASLFDIATNTLTIVLTAWVIRFKLPKIRR
jgi:VanZ family protein